MHFLLLDILRYGWKFMTLYVCMYVWMDGWMDGWMDVCMYVWMDGWMDGCMRACMYIYECSKISPSPAPEWSPRSLPKGPLRAGWHSKPKFSKASEQTNVIQNCQGLDIPVVASMAGQPLLKPTPANAISNLRVPSRSMRLQVWKERCFKEANQKANLDTVTTRIYLPLGRHGKTLQARWKHLWNRNYLRIQRNHLKPCEISPYFISFHKFLYLHLSSYNINK